VHQYSKKVPVLDALFEYLYYWVFTWLISSSILVESFAPPSPQYLLIGGTIWLLGEVGNCKCHLMLKGFRGASGASSSNLKARYPMPKGFLFDFVSCPHYMCEILSWFGFCLMTQTLPALSFFTIGAGIMITWAKERHNNYLKNYPNYPTSRKMIFPFLL